MRLVCPNCAAQYEVDETVIPETGRDVQCSNCGQMWFQPGPAAMLSGTEDSTSEPDGWDVAPVWDEGAARGATEVAPAPEAGARRETAEAATARSVSAVIAAFAAEPEPADLPAVPGWAPEARAIAGAAPGADPDDDPEDASADGPSRAPAAPAAVRPAPQPGSQPRRALDDSLLAILREEAEREARARRAEGTAIETQAEFNLSPALAAAPPTPSARPVAARPVAAGPAEVAQGIGPTEGTAPLGAEVPGLDDDERVADLGPGPGPMPPPAPSAARERLPDIEEINSTLRAASERGLGTGFIRPEATTERPGFRLGFGGVMLIAGIGALIYVFAAPIGTRLPAAAPVLGAYVAAVDQGRIWLDGQLQRAIDSMQPAQDS